MRCSQCGKEKPEGSEACLECVAGPPGSVQYAGFMARSMALACDLFVGLILAMAPTFALTFLFSGRMSGDFWSPALFVLVYVLYMVVAQYFFHTTIGKRLFGLQIRSVARPRPHPDLLELLFRESVGKYLSGCWIGQGFLASTYDSMHMTWADRLVGTVVVKALPVSRTMKVVRILLFVVILLALGLMVLGLAFPS